MLPAAGYLHIGTLFGGSLNSCIKDKNCGKITHLFGIVTDQVIENDFGVASLEAAKKA